jgi:hypothetical protein
VSSERYQEPGEAEERDRPHRSEEPQQSDEREPELPELAQDEELDPELQEMQRRIRERAEMEQRISELEEPERTWLRVEMEERVRELQEIEEAERERVVREALGKFGVFMHLTAYIAGVAYLVLLAVFVHESVPWVFIPMGLWTIGIGYHFWRAWHPKKPEDKALETLDDEMGDEGKRR